MIAHVNALFELGSVALSKSPNHSMFPFTLASHSCQPETVLAHRVDASTIAAASDADPPGEAAAPHVTVARENATSEALVDVGLPYEIPSHQADGRETAAPPSSQSSMAFRA